MPSAFSCHDPSLRSILGFSALTIPTNGMPTTKYEADTVPNTLDWTTVMDWNIGMTFDLKNVHLIY
jgi:hypothetical protein